MSSFTRVFTFSTCLSRVAGGLSGVPVTPEIRVPRVGIEQGSGGGSLAGAATRSPGL